MLPPVALAASSTGSSGPETDLNIPCQDWAKLLVSRNRFLQHRWRSLMVGVPQHSLTITKKQIIKNEVKHDFYQSFITTGIFLNQYL